MRAALLDRNNRVIGEVYYPPRTGNIISVASSITNGDAVNCVDYKISRSRANLVKAEHQQPLVQVGTEQIWTFHYMGDVWVM